MTKPQVTAVVDAIDAKLRVDSPSLLSAAVVNAIQDQIIAEFSRTQLESDANYAEVRNALQKKLNDAQVARRNAAPGGEVAVLTDTEIDTRITAENAKRRSPATAKENYKHNTAIDEKIAKRETRKTQGQEWHDAIGRLEGLVTNSQAIVSNFTHINRFPDRPTNASHNVMPGATATLSLTTLTNPTPVPTYALTIEGQEIAAATGNYTFTQGGATYEIRGIHFTTGNPPQLNLSNVTILQNGVAIPSGSLQFELRAERTIQVNNAAGTAQDIVLTSRQPISLNINSNRLSPADQSAALNTGAVQTKVNTSAQVEYNMNYANVENALLDEFMRAHGADVLSDAERNALRTTLRNTVGFAMAVADFQTASRSIQSPLIDPSFVGDSAMYSAKITSQSDAQLTQLLHTAGFLKATLQARMVPVFTAMRDSVNTVTGQLSQADRAAALTARRAEVDSVSGPLWLATHVAVETSTIEALLRSYAPGITFTPAEKTALETALRGIAGLIPTQAQYQDASVTERSTLIAGTIRGTQATLEAAIAAGTGDWARDAMRTKLQSFLQAEIDRNATEPGRATAISTAITAAVTAHNASTLPLPQAQRVAALADPGSTARIYPIADTVFASVPDPLSAAIDDVVNSHVGTSTLDKTALRNNVRTFLAGLTPPFTFDNATFRAASISASSPLVPASFTGTQAMLVNAITSGTGDRTSAAMRTKLQGFLQSAIIQQLEDPTAAWNTGPDTIITRITGAMNAHNTTTLPLARANQHAAITTPPNDFTPRITNTLRVTYRANGEYIAALRSQLTAMIIAQGANALTDEQRTRTVDALLPQVLAITGGAPVITEADLATQFLDPAAAMRSPLYDDAFTGTPAAFRDRVNGLLTQTDPAQPNIPTMGKAFLRNRIDARLNNNLATLVPGTTLDLQTVVQNAVNTTLGNHVDTAHNLITTTTGGLTTNLLATYATNRGNYFPIQDEVSRRYRGRPIVRNFRRFRDNHFGDGPDVTQERVRTVADNSYMTFFEQIDTSANPEKIEKVALPSGLGEVDITAAVQYHPGQNSLAQNGTVTINVSGTQVNVGPIESISNGFGVHGIIEAILRQDFHADTAVNNVIRSNAIIAVYKVLVRAAQEKFGALRIGTQTITINNNGNLIYNNGATPPVICSEQDLRDTNDYTVFTNQLPALAAGFHAIMTGKNNDYIAGITANHIATPGMMRPLGRMRYRRLLAQPLEFTAAGITGTYNRSGHMHLALQSPEGEQVELEGNMETVFSSPMLYGKQHEVLEAFYKAFAGKVMTSRRANRSAGFYCVHDGRTYGIINRGTPAAPQLVYGEIPAAVAGGAGAYAFPGGGGRLPRNMVNTITPVNERTMLSNPQLMNTMISVMAGGV